MLSVEKSTALGYKSQTLWTKQAAAFRGVEGIGQIRKVLWFFFKVSSGHFQNSTYYSKKLSGSYLLFQI